jgi:hypothetical protein
VGATALMQSNDPKAIDALLAATATGSPVAIYTLGQSHHPRATLALISFLQDPESKSEERAIAAEALGKSGMIALLSH